jgi:hypothetical protein
MKDQEQEEKQEMEQEQKASGLSRREFLRDAGLAVAGTAAGAAMVACNAQPAAVAPQAPAATIPPAPATKAAPAAVPGAAVIEPAFEPEETRCLTFGT